MPWGALGIAAPEHLLARTDQPLPQQCPRDLSRSRKKEQLRAKNEKKKMKI